MAINGSRRTATGLKPEVNIDIDCGIFFESLDTVDGVDGRILMPIPATASGRPSLGKNRTTARTHYRPRKIGSESYTA